MKIKKAIIPVAGFGTRMLPATKAIPKELLPILDKPLIQYVAEEAISAGIKEIIFITRTGKEAIENHFDKNFELEYLLERKGQKKILKSIKNVIPKHVKTTSVNQNKALGLGHAILCASHLIEKGEFFSILLPDEFLLSKENSNDLSKMIKKFDKNTKGQILVEKVKRKDTKNYGIIDLDNKRLRDQEAKSVKGFIEKPPIKKAPSNYRIVGRYILPFEIFSHLKKISMGKDGEIQLTDALQSLVEENSECFEASLSKSNIFDCGSKKGFIGANIATASRDRDMIKFLKEIIGT